MIGRHCKGRRVSYVHNGGVRVEQFGEGEGDLECGSGFSELAINVFVDCGEVRSIERERG